MAGPAPLLFLGSKPLGLRLLEELAVLAGGRLAAAATCDDSSDERSCLPAFRAFAQSRGLPLEILPPREIGSWVERWRPYAVVVCGWYWKIPGPALAKAPGGFLGLHASLLPRYRGNAPLVWALLNGEAEAGVSLFRMEEGMDTGDLLAQERFPLGPDETIADALAKAEAASLAALRRAAPGLLAGSPAFRPQSAEGISVFPKRTPADGRLDWGSPSGAVYNAIRAQTRPYPGAFAYLKGRKVIIWSAARDAASGTAGSGGTSPGETGPTPSAGAEGPGRADAGGPDGNPGIHPGGGDDGNPPGRVLEAGPGGARVACGSGSVVLREIQFEGEAARPAGDCLRAGERLA